MLPVPVEQLKGAQIPSISTPGQSQWPSPPATLPDSPHPCPGLPEPPLISPNPSRRCCRALGRFSGAASRSAAIPSTLTGACALQEEDSLQIEEKIKWGDGFAVVYSVTDRCSFDEVMRLCFLINHLHASPKRSGATEQPPVVIVGNKKDLQFDRMVSTEDGENLSKALKIPFYEISTRDSYEEPVAVFSSLYQELLRQGHFSPGSFKRRTVSKLMEKIPKMQASSTLNSAGRSLSFNSFRDYIPE